MRDKWLWCNSIWTLVICMSYQQYLPSTLSTDPLQRAMIRWPSAAFCIAFVLPWNERWASQSLQLMCFAALLYEKYLQTLETLGQSLQASFSSCISIPVFLSSASLRHDRRPSALRTAKQEQIQHFAIKTNCTHCNHSDLLSSTVFSTQREHSARTLRTHSEIRAGPRTWCRHPHKANFDLHRQW